MPRNIDWSDLGILAYSNTPSEIARIKGCGKSTVRRVLKRFQVKYLKRLHVPQATLDKIRELYTTGLSSTDIANELALPAASVKVYLQNMGIRRSRREALKLKYSRRGEQQVQCPHQFTIRLENGGFACLSCKKHFYSSL
jgi:DNA invertase Pin-like site-specific DNA recombinase